ncbi:class I adenylate-forming enzyme family protein [Natrinema salaciae]|uniref:Long-chain acyl-CoA synthetase n=1 Tax=Natrinema salaciae TaxID=1186196 RepID=A0A1H9EB98_9EURY|nr:class I adenylate-forming enzyme family protein [Natrinema salaciae]SEQ23016.1 long-chain acyl-CoA synthetase [Natrinema salaciae]
MTNFVKELQSAVRANPTATAVVGDEPTTYSSLWSATDSFAGALQDREIAAGDRISIHLSDPHSTLAAIYGSLRAGCVPVTMPQQYENRDIRRVLSETDSKALVTDSSPIMTLLTSSEALRVAITADADTRMGVALSTVLENDGMNGSNSRTGIDVVRRSDDAPALIAYVDRYEGDPLAVVHTHASLRAAATAETPLSRTDADGEVGSHRSSLPLSNPIELMYGASATLVDGGQYRPIETPDPEYVRSVLETTAADRTFVTPRQYRELRTRDPSAGGGLRVVEPATTAVGGQSGDPGDSIRLCGLPETGISHVRTPADIESGTIGRPLPGVRSRVLEGTDGDELAVTGPTLMDGYFDRPTLTAETTATLDGDRWIKTGIPARASDGTIVLETGSEPADPSSSR